MKGPVRKLIMKNVGIVCCSNGQSIAYKKDIDELIDILKAKGINPVLSDYIYENGSAGAGTAIERANALMKFYMDYTISEIYDISGGDIANEILPYLDNIEIWKSNKIFYGYSDLTTVINALYTLTGRESVLYQVKNLVWDKTGLQKNIFLTEEMFDFDYKFLQGNKMEGFVVGGNIRCLLKLAGTRYFPDISKKKIIFLEANSGMEPQLSTYFAQLKQMGVFEKLGGVLLGTFSEMRENGREDEAIRIAMSYIGDGVPVAKTDDIGHQHSSKAIVIGRKYVFE